MIKAGIGSDAYFDLTNYETGLKQLSRHGYTGTDFEETMQMNSPLYAMSDEELVNFLNKISAYAKENGVEIYQLHSIWPTAGDDKAEGREKSLWYYRRSMFIAKHLSCKRVVVHPWMPYGFSNGGSSEELVSLNVELLKTLMPTAHELGVYVCLENMPRKGTPFSTLKEWMAVLTEVNDEYAKACLDTGHLNVMGEDAYETVVTLGKYLEAMHVHDNIFGMDLHMLPYQGSFDWEGFLKGLKAIGFDGCISLETSIHKPTPDAVKEKMQIALADLVKEMIRQIEE